MKNKKYKDLIVFAVGLGIIILINLLASNFFFRLDLTEEKRFTMSQATIQMLENLDGEVTVEVYLDGDLPSGFRRLQKAVRIQLESFRAYAGEKVHFTFFDPAS